MSANLLNKIEQRLPPRRAQLLTICYVGFIYATLPVTRPALNFLKGTLGEAFSTTIYAFLFLIALGIIVLLLREGRGWKSLALLVAILGVTASILPSIKLPEERIHFLEYAVLGVLLYFALWKNIQGRRLFLFIPALVLLIGFGDELIQGIVPNRFYQFTDVLMNFSGGILGELILITFNPGLSKREKSVYET